MLNDNRLDRILGISPDVPVCDPASEGLSRRFISGPSTSPRLATLAPPWSPIGNKPSKSPSGGSLCDNAPVQRRREAPSAACRCYAAPDSSDDPLRTSTILPVTPPFPSNSCACLASARGNRCAMSGLIFCC